MPTLAESAPAVPAAAEGPSDASSAKPRDPVPSEAPPNEPESKTQPAAVPEPRKSTFPWLAVVAALVAVLFLWTKNRAEPEPTAESTVSVEPASPKSPRALSPVESPPPQPSPPSEAEPEPTASAPDEAPVVKEPSPKPPAPDAPSEKSATATPAPNDAPPAAPEPATSSTEAAAAPTPEPTTAEEADPEPTAPSGVRTVVVKALPTGAHIGHQGKELGRNSVEVQVAEGERKALEISLPGYSARRLVIDGSQAEVTVILKPLAPAAP